MVPPTITKPSFSHSQSLPSGSFHKPLILICQRADRRKTRVKENFSNWSHGPQPCLTQWNYEPCPVQFSSVPESCQTLCDPMDWSTPGSLFITNSWNLLRLLYIKVVMPSNHLILCCPLLLKPSIFPSIRVFSDDSVLFWQSLFFFFLI